MKDRAKFLDLARGSALECSATQDALVIPDGLSREADQDLKSRLVRMVAMLTSMAVKVDGVSELPNEYKTSSDYEHEHRDAEHEHEEELEQRDADEGLDRTFMTCIKSTPRPH